MALLTRKPILLNSDFENHDNPFYENNQVLKSVTHSSLPSAAEDVLLSKGSQTYHAVNNVLAHLLDNDRFIAEYIAKLQNQSVSKGRAAEAFSQNVTALTSNIYEKAYEQHIESYHENPELVPLSTLYREYLKADCSNLDVEAATKNFTKTEKFGGCTFLSNDFVSKIEFNDSPTVRLASNYVNVAVKNSYTNNKFMTQMAAAQQMANMTSVPSTRESTYIYKEYISGKKELYIYIPSTFTFYNEQLSSGTAHNPHADATYVRIKLNKRHFQLNHIYNLQINGQSLPLMIHKDKKAYFSDQILPSIARTICTSISSDNNIDSIYDENTNLYTLYFCCYGTDAQAIKILAD